MGPRACSAYSNDDCFLRCRELFSHSGIGWVFHWFSDNQPSNRPRANNEPLSSIVARLSCLSLSLHPDESLLRCLLVWQVVTVALFVMASACSVDPSSFATPVDRVFCRCSCDWSCIPHCLSWQVLAQSIFLSMPILVVGSSLLMWGTSWPPVTTHSKSKDGRPALHEGAVSFFHPSSALLCRLPRLLGG